MDHHCGCCGRKLTPHRVNFPWCARCEVHTINAGPMESRTYFGRFKRDCPWQVGTDIAAAEGEARRDH